MNTHPHLKSQPASAERLSSFTWAFFLLTPLFILARSGNSGTLYFHILLFSGGWLSWTYTEYFFHRFIMHNSGPQKGLSRLFNHSHHHHDPADIRVNRVHRILMVFASSASLLLAFFLNDYFTIFSGYLCGFTIYSLMHVILHQKWSATLFPQLHRFHIHHHCKHPDKCFGVTFTWWDHLFGTVPFSETGLTGRIRNFYYQTGTGSEEISRGENKLSAENRKDKNSSCIKCKNVTCLNKDVRIVPGH